MAKLLLNLRHVPDDEADEVRDMLAKYDIPYYETPPNRWGITVGGIWVRDDDRVGEAKALMAEYQQERHERALADREARRLAGELDTFWRYVRRNPLQVLAAIVGVAFIIYVLFLPIFGLGG